MNVEQLSELRRRTGWTQAQVADALGVTTRTIANWESSPPQKELSPRESRDIGRLFQPILLESQIQEMVHRAFKAIPSEMVSIWLVHESECFVLPNTTRLHFTPNVPLYQVRSSLVILSLTTYPLRSGETLNLAGKAITDHKAKRFRHNRASAVLKSGWCESLLHVPAFTPSARGPQPVLLLSLENKLDEEGAVVEALHGVEKIYTEDDEKVARALAEEFKEHLLPDMKLLDMIT